MKKTSEWTASCLGTLSTLGGLLHVPPYCQKPAFCGWRVVLSRKDGCCGGLLSGFRARSPRPSGGPVGIANWAQLGMADRSSRPHRSPNQTPTRTERRIIKVRVIRRWGPAQIGYFLGIHPSTVHRVLIRHGVARLRWLNRCTGRVVRRIESAAAGDLVHVDVKKLGRVPAGGGWRKLGRMRISAPRCSSRCDMRSWLRRFQSGIVGQRHSPVGLPAVRRPYRLRPRVGQQYTGLRPVKRAIIVATLAGVADCRVHAETGAGLPKRLTSDH